MAFGTIKTGSTPVSPAKVCGRISTVDSFVANEEVVGSTPTVRSSLGEVMYKFHLNADLREVWLRLAGDFKAEVAQAEERLNRNQQGGVSNTSFGSTLLQEDNDANTD